MKLFIVSFMFSILPYSMLFAFDELEARRNLIYAAKDKEKAYIYYDNLKNVSLSSPAVLLGYRGMAELMICHHSYNPYVKWSYFVKGKKTLEDAIKKQPDNVELRYLRFCVQMNAPAFLGYNTEIENDKAILLRFLKNEANETDKDLIRIVTRYFIETGIFNDKKEITTQLK